MRYKISNKEAQPARHPVEFLPVDQAIAEIEKTKIAKATKTLLIAILKRTG